MLSLIDDPWIPVLMADGKSAVVSLRQALADAGRISRVTAGSPLEDRAIERLLIAICWRAGGRDQAPAYLDHWHGQFELDRFCQYQIRPYTPKNFGLDRLLLTGHAPEQVDAAQAARALLVRLLWDSSGIRTGLADDPMSSGGKSMPIGPAILAAAPTLIVHPGALAGMLDWNQPDGEWQASCMPPTWEDATDRPRGTYTVREAGTGRLLVWPGRRIRLTLTSDGDTCTGALVANGDRISDYAGLPGVAPHAVWETTQAGKLISRRATLARLVSNNPNP